MDVGRQERRRARRRHDGSSEPRVATDLKDEKGHKAGREFGYGQLEKLHNIEQLPPTGFTVVCFPVKVARASAGWTRAVAILEE
jgi:kynurenine formamidase